jgi:hypothetical protein
MAKTNAQVGERECILHCLSPLASSPLPTLRQIEQAGFNIQWLGGSAYGLDERNRPHQS